MRQPSSLRREWEGDNDDVASPAGSVVEVGFDSVDFEDISSVKASRFLAISAVVSTGELMFHALSKLGEDDSRSKDEGSQIIRRFYERPPFPQQTLVKAMQIWCSGIESARKVHQCRLCMYLRALLANCHHSHTLTGDARWHTAMHFLCRARTRPDPLRFAVGTDMD